MSTETVKKSAPELLGEVLAEMSSLRGEVESLRQEVQAKEGATAKHRARIESTVDGVVAQQSTYQSKLDQVSKSVDAKLTGFGKKIATAAESTDFEERAERLGQALNGALESGVRKLDNSVEKMDEVIAGSRKQADRHENALNNMLGVFVFSGAWLTLLATLMVGTGLIFWTIVFGWEHLVTASTAWWQKLGGGAVVLIALGGILWGLFAAGKWLHEKWRE